MTAVLVSRELFFATKLTDIAARAGARLLRVDSPAQLPPPASVRLVLVDWAERSPDWGHALADWCAAIPESARPRVILYGPHMDLEAHAAAGPTGLGPMWARSKLMLALPGLL